MAREDRLAEFPTTHATYLTACLDDGGDGALRDAGVRVNVVMELRSIPAILRMVETTGRLAFVSQLGIGPYQTGQAPKVRRVAIAGLSITRKLAIIAKRERPLSPAAAAFKRELLTSARS